MTSPGIARQFDRCAEQLERAAKVIRTLSLGVNDSAVAESCEEEARLARNEANFHRYKAQYQKSMARGES